MHCYMPKLEFHIPEYYRGFKQLLFLVFMIPGLAYLYQTQFCREKKINFDVFLLYWVGLIKIFSTSSKRE